MSKNTKITKIEKNKKDTIEEKNVELTVEEQFKKKTLHQHVLDRPGMYIGPIRTDKVNMYVYNDDTNSIIRKDINVVLGLYKIFDEILVNAADHTTRDKKCNRIDVNIYVEKNTIEVKNNGTSVPVEFHKDEKMYVPEMVFGTLLTSGNYDDTEERIVGGMNGLGSKCIGSLENITLFDGTIKKAKDIMVGELLIGDDGTARKVLRVTKGIGQMYEIIQVNGESYTVNDNHTLTLHMPNHKVIFWNDNGFYMSWWNHKEKCISSKFIKVYEKNNKRKLFTFNPEDNEENEEINKAKFEMEEFADLLKGIIDFIGEILKAIN
jgi:hypothetical protein